LKGNDGTRLSVLALSFAGFVLAGCDGDAGAGAQGGAYDGSLSPDSNTPGGGSPGGLTASPFFGVTVNSTTAANDPTLSYGVQRIWDSPPFQWQTLETAPCHDITSCAGGYDSQNLSRLDDYLAHLPTVGVKEVIYTMARTPHFATAFPNDATCNNTDTAPGACDRPSDLADDGTGSNQTFRMWYAFFAKRLNSPSYLAAHAHVRYWEIWNEPDTPAFWGNGSGGHGSYAALVRMAEDMRCMLTGQGVVTNYPTVGAKTPCAQAGLPAIGIDPSALIMSPSYHARDASLTQLRDFLYCSNPTHDATCNTGFAGANAVDIINMHMKPGSECVDNGASPSNCTVATSVEAVYASYLADTRATLQDRERTEKPIWNDESDYAPKSFAAPYTDDDMAASYVARFLLVGWSLGVGSHDWYTWDRLKDFPAAVVAWNTIYGWMVGATLTSPCAVVSAGSIYSCSLSRNGASYQIDWDSAKACGGGQCTSSAYTVASTWRTYSQIDGSAPVPIGPTLKVSLGVKPLLLSR
jgi:hypothetical protein